MSKFKSLELLLKKGQISRREFIRRTGTLGAAGAMAPSLLSSTAQAAPKKGGRFRIGLAGGSTTDSLDPGTLPDMMPQLLNRQVRNTLVEITHKGEPVPELAESWESSADASTWKFNLRKGVEFHGGKTMTQDDVMFSINHHRGETSNSAAKGVVDPIKEMKKDGDNGIVFTLAEGNADFPFILSDYHLTICPDGTTDFEKGIGTGGYVLQSHEPGVRAMCSRNANYWKANSAHFDEVETLGIKDASARTNALRTGQVDAMNRCEIKTVHLLKKAPGITVVESNGTKHYTIPMMTNQAPYDNNEVRLALKHGIDREQLLKTVLRGYGSLGNDHPIGKNQQYFDTSIEQRKYDPDQAMFHLKKAGMENHAFQLHVADAAFGGAVDSAVLYQESAAKAGIKIEVVKEPSDGYWSNVWMQKPWTFSFWSGRPTCDWMFSIAYAEGANWNESFWSHKRFNELLKMARAELDNDKRAKMYAEMQMLCRDEGGSVIPMFAADLTGISDKIGHGDIAADWEMDGMRAFERWWFA